MNCAKKLLSKVALFCCALALAGCTSTIAPKLASSSQASWDQGGQNSGILGSAGFLVTEHFVDRYNGLIALYGAKFSPPLTPNQGVYFTPTNTFVMGNMAMEHFVAMNRWRKQGAPPWFKP